MLARLLLVCLLTLSIHAQQPAKKHWLIRITPARPDFLTSMTKDEQRIIADHFQYLKTVLADGRLVLAGPVEATKEPFGIIIVETPTEQEARTIMEGDPSVKAGVMKGEVLPFSLALMRGRQVP